MSQLWVDAAVSSAIIEDAAGWVEPKNAARPIVRVYWRDMPKKKDKTDDSALISAAKTVGAAAGKIASLIEKLEPTSRSKAKAAGKLKPKNKSRLPRRQKKAQKKAAAR